MRKKWRLRKGSNSLVIVRRADIFPEDLGYAPSPVGASDLDRWIADSSSRQVLFEMYDCLHGSSANNAREAGAEQLQGTVRRWLEDAFKRRDIIAVLVKQNHLTQVAVVEEGQEKAKSERDAVSPGFAKTITWIEIELVDSQNRPVRNERFRMELPGGEFYEGTTDNRGSARIEGIDPGVCELNFPERDMREWSAA
jgi:hypothetical protein